LGVLWGLGLRNRRRWAGYKRQRTTGEQDFGGQVGCALAVAIPADTNKNGDLHLAAPFFICVKSAELYQAIFR
jgi:hypothetical protein